MRKKKEKIDSLKLFSGALKKICKDSDTPTGVDIPYPNLGRSSDTTSGAKKVKIDGREGILKKGSLFKGSQGDEPGTVSNFMKKISKRKRVNVKKT